MRLRSFSALHCSSSLQRAVHCCTIAFSSLVIFLSVPSPLQSQTEVLDEQWRWVHFTTASGLPSDYITSLTETRDGTLWVGTRAGIAWYDGYEWIRIDSSLGLPPGCPASMVPNLRDSILVMIENTVLEYPLYIGSKKGFRVIPLGRIGAAVPFVRDSLLVLKNSSLSIYDKGRLTPFHSSLFPREWDGKYELWGTKEGSVWVNCPGGLYRWEGVDWNCELKADSTRFTLTPHILVENDNGTGLASIDEPFDRRGLWEWNKHSRPSLSIEVSGYFVKAADVGPDDEAVAVGASDEIRFRRRGIWSTVHFQHDQVRDIECVRFRSNGDLCVGTQHGLFLYRRSSSMWKYVRHDLPDPRNSITEILRASDGALWLGTANGIEMHKPDGTITTVERIENRRLDVVTGIAEDVHGDIWISSGSSFTGAFRWHQARWQYIDQGTPLAGIKFHKIRTDGKGRPWFLGVSGNNNGEPGAFVYTGDKFIRWGKDEGLPSGSVYAFAEGRNGALWFGTLAGLSRWDAGTWTHWNSTQLSASRVFDAEIDMQHNVWFADGLHTVGFIDEHDSVHQVTTADGLINDEVWDIGVDEHGRVWMATAEGLCSYDRGQWSSFDWKTGLASSRLYPVLPHHNQIYVGSRGNGLAILTLGVVDQPSPRIVLDEPVQGSENVLLRWKALAYWGDPSPESIPTRFRLNNGMWSNWSTTRETSLPRPGPGTYSFRVQARGLFGNFDATGVDRSFTVTVPIWQTWYFRFASVVLLLSVIGFVLLGRVRSLTKEKLALADISRKLIESQEGERKRVASELHDSIGQDLLVVKNEIQQYMLDSGESKDRLARVSSLVQESIERVREISSNLHPHLLDRLGLKAALEAMIEKIGNSSTIRINFTIDEIDHALSRESQINFFRIIQEAVSNIVRHSEATNATIDIKANPSHIFITILDDGKGFDPKRTSAVTGGRLGFGLSGIAERARLLGGTLNIRSGPGAGTTLEAKLPINRV
jgi:signal transduction histidine kinase/ligand-binding sensor domain-containing protein